MSPPATIAFQTLDCAAKVRVHYYLPWPLTVEVMKVFDDASVQVQAFSRHVAGAYDHVTFHKGTWVHGAGVLGQSRLVVTYGKRDQRFPADEIARVEAQLRAAGCDVVYRRTRPPAG